MNKKMYILVIIIMLLSLVLSACTRSATGKSPTCELTGRHPPAVVAGRLRCSPFARGARS